MSKVKLVMGLMSASVVTAAIMASPALAWHPQGVIVKYVQNQTTNSPKSDANDASSAITAKPGDVLKYTIEIRNDGKKDSRGWNDMARTVMTDTLPAGVELVNDPTTRAITANIGLIKAGDKVVKEYTVKVVAASDSTITNKACFTGETTNNEPQNAQKGCDVAIVKVKVPESPKTPEQPKQPETPKAPEAPKTPVVEVPAELPNTGSAAVFGGLTGASSLGLAGYYYLRSKRNLRDARNR